MIGTSCQVFGSNNEHSFELLDTEGIPLITEGLDVVVLYRVL